MGVIAAYLNGDGRWATNKEPFVGGTPEIPHAGTHKFRTALKVLDLMHEEARRLASHRDGVVTQSVGAVMPVLVEVVQREIEHAAGIFSVQYMPGPSLDMG